LITYFSEPFEIWPIEYATNAAFAAYEAKEAALVEKLISELDKAMEQWEKDSLAILAEGYAVHEISYEMRGGDHELDADKKKSRRERKAEFCFFNPGRSFEAYELLEFLATPPSDNEYIIDPATGKRK